MNKSSIGKGLKELLQENEYIQENSEIISEIPLNEIKPNPYQPRRYFSETAILELAESIKANGLFQPIIVKKMSGYYAIVAGERRYRACKSLNLPTIPAIIRTYEKEKVIQIALIENLQREDLSPIEEARGYMQIMRELDLTQAQVALRVGKSRSHVTNMLGLLSLPEEVIDMVDRKELSMGHARVISKFEDVDKIRSLAKLIVEKSLSVRKIEEIARNEKSNNKKEVKRNEFNKEEKLLREKYQTPVNINNGKIIFSTKGKIEEVIEKLLR